MHGVEKRCIAPYGNALVAVKAFEPGDVVIRDRPILVTAEINDLVDCIYEDHRLLGIRADLLAKDASIDFTLQLLQYCNTNDEIKAAVRRLFAPDVEIFHDAPYVRAARQYSEQLLAARAASSETLERSLLAQIVNNCPPDEMVRVVLTWVCNSYSTCDGGAALYEHGSLVNHCCEGNTRYRFFANQQQADAGEDGNSGYGVFIAVRPIRPGDVITTCYLGWDEQTLMSTRMRRKLLVKTKLFSCTCLRCSRSHDPYRAVPCFECGCDRQQPSATAPGRELPTTTSKNIISISNNSPLINAATTDNIINCSSSNNASSSEEYNNTSGITVPTSSTGGNNKGDSGRGGSGAGGGGGGYLYWRGGEGGEGRPWVCDTCCQGFGEEEVRRHLRHRADQLAWSSAGSGSADPEAALEEEVQGVAEQLDWSDLAVSLGTVRKLGAVCQAVLGERHWATNRCRYTVLELCTAALNRTCTASRSGGDGDGCDLHSLGGGNSEGGAMVYYRSIGPSGGGVGGGDDGKRRDDDQIVSDNVRAELQSHGTGNGGAATAATNGGNESARCRTTELPVVECTAGCEDAGTCSHVTGETAAAAPGFVAGSIECAEQAVAQATSSGGDGGNGGGDGSGGGDGGFGAVDGGSVTSLGNTAPALLTVTTTVLSDVPHVVHVNGERRKPAADAPRNINGVAAVAEHPHPPERGTEERTLPNGVPSTTAATVTTPIIPTTANGDKYDSVDDSISSRSPPLPLPYFAVSATTAAPLRPLDTAPGADSTTRPTDSLSSPIRHPVRQSPLPSPAPPPPPADVSSYVSPQLCRQVLMQHTRHQFILHMQQQQQQEDEQEQQLKEQQQQQQQRRLGSGEEQCEGDAERRDPRGEQESHQQRSDEGDVTADAVMLAPEGRDEKAADGGSRESDSACGCGVNGIVVYDDVPGAGCGERLAVEGWQVPYGSGIQGSGANSTANRAAVEAPATSPSTSPTKTLEASPPAPAPAPLPAPPTAAAATAGSEAVIDSTHVLKTEQLSCHPVEPPDSSVLPTGPTDGGALASASAPAPAGVAAPIDATGPVAADPSLPTGPTAPAAAAAVAAVAAAVASTAAPAVVVRPPHASESRGDSTSCWSVEEVDGLVACMCEELQALWQWQQRHTPDQPEVVLKAVAGPAATALMEAVKDELCSGGSLSRAALALAEVTAERLVAAYTAAPFYDVSGQGAEEAATVLMLCPLIRQALDLDLEGEGQGEG